MVKILCALGALLSALAGGYVAHIAPMNDPYMWLVVFLLICAFGCFLIELTSDGTAGQYNSLRSYI